MSPCVVDDDDDILVYDDIIKGDIIKSFCQQFQNLQYIRTDKTITKVWLNIAIIIVSGVSDHDIHIRTRHGHCFTSMHDYFVDRFR